MCDVWEFWDTIVISWIFHLTPLKNLLPRNWFPPPGHTASRSPRRWGPSDEGRQLPTSRRLRSWRPLCHLAVTGKMGRFPWVRKKTDDGVQMPNHVGELTLELLWTIAQNPSRMLKCAGTSLVSIVVSDFFQCCDNEVEGIRRRVALEKEKTNGRKWS